MESILLDDIYLNAIPNVIEVVKCINLIGSDAWFCNEPSMRAYYRSTKLSEQNGYDLKILNFPRLGFGSCHFPSQFQFLLDSSHFSGPNSGIRQFLTTLLDIDIHVLGLYCSLLPSELPTESHCLSSGLCFRRDRGQKTEDLKSVKSSRSEETSHTFEPE